MSSTLQLKRHIKSAKNIGQVTKALEMVSAVKMRKAQAESLAGRPYTDQLVTTLNTLTRSSSTDHPYLRRPKDISKILLVIIAPHKGLAGSLITNLSRQVLLLLKSYKEKSVQIEIVTWGKKSRSIAVKTGFPVLADFYADVRLPISEHISALSHFLTNYFKSLQTDLIIIAHNQFINTMTQTPAFIQFLPLSSLPDPKSELGPLYQFEPNKPKLLNSLMEHYVHQSLTQIILDGFAAEHSARMVAMKNAHENAETIVSDFTLLYNKTRQANITSEIADNVHASSN